MVWKVELSGEVRAWYDQLGPTDLLVADRVIARLKQEGNMIRMPLSRPLRDGLFELRFDCEGRARRITYVFEPERKVITLTTFHKQKNNERREILRARRAQAARAAEHTERQQESKKTPEQNKTQTRKR